MAALSLPEAKMTPDLIVTNARVLTMDASNPRAEAVVMTAGKIAFVGATKECTIST